MNLDGCTITGTRRELWLRHCAGGFARQGLASETIARVLLAENEVRCSPPLEAPEVNRIARSREYETHKVGHRDAAFKRFDRITARRVAGRGGQAGIGEAVRRPDRRIRDGVSHFLHNRPDDSETRSVVGEPRRR